MILYRASLIFRLLCLGGIFYAGVAFSVTTLDLPDIGDSAGRLISPEYERRLGQAFLRQVRMHTSIVVDPEIEEYITAIGNRLASYSDDNTRPFTFFMVLNPSINAFAGPGGVIGINTGVILKSQSESELAAVLAHEIAHVTQRHLARSFEQISHSRIPTVAAMLGAVLVGLHNPGAGAAAFTAVTGINIENRINFTRANEAEADRVGMQLLARAQYDPLGMPGFFQRLQQGSQFQSHAPEFLRTHPLTTSRIADSRARAESYERGRYFDSDAYKLVRTKLEVFSQKSADDAVKVFEHKLKQEDEQSKNRKFIRYGYALALARKGAFIEARQQLAYLLKQDSKNLSYILAAGDVESASKNYDLAEKIYQDAYKMYPGYRPLIFAYSKTLLDALNPEEARNVLRRYRVNYNYKFDPVFHDLLAQAETQSGYEGEGAIAKAEYYYLIGATEAAIDKLKFTENRIKLSNYQEQRILARREELERELAMEKRLKIR